MKLKTSEYILTRRLIMRRHSISSTESSYHPRDTHERSELYKKTMSRFQLTTAYALEFKCNISHKEFHLTLNINEYVVFSNTISANHIY